MLRLFRLLLIAPTKGLKLTVLFELSADGPISQQNIEETKVVLRELGLDDQLRAG
jgi:hypothetical protein